MIVARSVDDEQNSSFILADLTKENYGIALVRIPEGKRLLWVRWAGNDRLLVSLALPGKLFGVEFVSSRLFVFDVTERKFRAVNQNVGALSGDDVIHIDPEGRFILLSAQRSLLDYPTVWRVDLTTLEMTKEVKPHNGVWNWYADPEGTVRAGIGIDGRRWWLLYRGPGETKFQRIVKGRVSGREQSESDIDRVIPVAGSDKGYAIASKTTGRYAIYHYDFATDTLGEPLFEHPQVDVDSVSYSFAKGDIAAIHYVDDRERIHWLDPDMKAIQARIDRTFPNSVNKIVSMDASGKILIVWSGTASDPGTYYVFDSGKGKMQELAKPYSALDGMQLSPVQHVRYQARDGLEIPAYLTLPRGKTAEKLPLIVMPHGGPFIRDQWSYDPWVQFLADRGYAVLQPNFRGSTGYGRSFVEAGEGQWGRKMQDDIDDGVRWLVERGTADAGRVCIMGASYGGYAAMWAAARNPDMYRCAISFAGISDMEAMLRYDRRLFVAQRYYRDWRDRVRGDRKFDLDRISPLESIDRISIPMLIAHGSDDDVVPASQSTELHKALTKAGKPHEYVLYEGEGHGFGKVENSVDFLKRVDAFLAAHNPAH